MSLAHREIKCEVTKKIWTLKQRNKNQFNSLNVTGVHEKIFLHINESW